MTLSKEEIKQLKQQLLEQVQHLPPEQKAQAEQQIAEMSPEALETMLKQQQGQQVQDVFRAIVSGKIPSRKIDENKQAIAVLDIAPIEQGHTIIIPKQQVKEPKDLPTQAFTLAKKIAKKINTKLKPKSVELITEKKFQETIINVIPQYSKPISLDSPRKQAQDQDLNSLYDLLRTRPRKKVIRQKKPKKTRNLRKIKRRIP